MNCFTQNPTTKILNSDLLERRNLNASKTDFVVQEYISSRNKQGKINYHRVIFETQKVDQSRRRPMKVFNIVQRNAYKEDEDFSRFRLQEENYKN